MKKKWYKIALPVMLVILLVIVYFAAPVRPAIAAWAANNYIESHYEQYDFPSAEIVTYSHHEYYFLEWLADYGAQSLTETHIVYVELNGWFPFVVQRSVLWETHDGESVQIDP